MDKIKFLNQLCQISNDTVLNTENFDLAMGYDTALNVVYDVLRKIADENNAQDEISILPIDFRNGFPVPFSLAFALSALCQATLVCGTSFTHTSGANCCILENANAAGYILQIQFQ